MSQQEVRAISTAALFDKWFADLPIGLRWAYIGLTQVCGMSGIENSPLDKWRAITGFSFDQQGDLLSKLEKRGLIVQEGCLVWIVDYWNHNPYFSLANAKHRTGVQKHLRKLPKSIIANDFAVYYGLERPFPEYGISGRFRRCREAKEALLTLANRGPERPEYDENGWSAAEHLENHSLGPHQIATEAGRLMSVDGRYPEGWDIATERQIVKALNDQGIEGHELIEAAEGAAMMRDDGRLRSVSPGVPMSLRIFRAEQTGTKSLLRMAIRFRDLVREGATPDEIDRAMGKYARVLHPAVALVV